MTCEHFEELLLDELDGRLALDDKPVLADHLAGCEDCRAFLAAQFELESALSELPKPQLSPQFTARVLRATEEPRASFFETAGNLLGVFAVAAAGALAVGVMFPNGIMGLSWAVAASLVSGGVWLTESLDLL